MALMTGHHKAAVAGKFEAAKIPPEIWLSWTFYILKVIYYPSAQAAAVLRLKSARIVMHGSPGSACFRRQRTQFHWVSPYPLYFMKHLQSNFLHRKVTDGSWDKRRSWNGRLATPCPGSSALLCKGFSDHVTSKSAVNFTAFSLPLASTSCTTYNDKSMHHSPRERMEQLYLGRSIAQNDTISCLGQSSHSWFGFCIWGERSAERFHLKKTTMGLLGNTRIYFKTCFKDTGYDETLTRNVPGTEGQIRYCSVSIKSSK